MKRLAICLALAALVSTAFAEAPPVSAKEAIQIAEQNIQQRGLASSIHIISVALERGSLLNGKSYWFVKWSRSIPADNPKNREIGIKVNMDGSAVRMVKEPGS